LKTGIVLKRLFLGGLIKSNARRFIVPELWESTKPEFSAAWNCVQRTISLVALAVMVRTPPFFARSTQTVRKHIFEIAAIFSLEMGLRNPSFGTYLFLKKEMAPSLNGLPSRLPSASEN